VTTANAYTAVVPTYERPDLLPLCLAALGRVNPAPTHILVSEGSTSEVARKTTAEICTSFGDRVELVSEPSEGNLCGNRNHLVRQVTTDLVLMIDDDLSIHDEFADTALRLLQTGQVEIVTQAHQPLWFTFRGHWRVREPGEAYGISLRCVMGATTTFREHPFDEAIVYGSEDLDFCLALGNARVVSTTLTPTDNSNGDIARYTPRARAKLANNSRVLVGIRRYWSSRPRLLAFLVLELGASLLGRTPLPRKCHKGQWKATAQAIVGVKATRP
jgi:hypothetical protein